jgi:hypothetical protein
MTSRRLKILILTSFAALAFSSVAHAAGGHYVFKGGTGWQQLQVRSALNASSFDWNRVSTQVKIHIKKGANTRAVPGQIWFDANLLNAGKYSWGYVQHEYAHQVDFFLLRDHLRSALAPILGGNSWWQTATFQQHSSLNCERFASTLAWAYWPSKDNALRPKSAKAESAAIAPAKFRKLLAEKLGA